MKSFSNKVAAITGAGSGMGRSLAIKLAKRGCHVAVSDVDEKNLAETAKLAGVHGVKVTSKRVDVAKRDEVYTWADEVVADHGKCNLIFNNAGVGYGASVEGCEYTDAEWLIGINFWGVVHGTKAFLPHLRASGEGHVVNTSSLFGLLGFPGQSTYNAIEVRGARVHRGAPHRARHDERAGQRDQRSPGRHQDEHRPHRTREQEHDGPRREGHRRTVISRSRSSSA